MRAFNFVIRVIALYACYTLQRLQILIKIYDSYRELDAGVVKTKNSPV